MARTVTVVAELSPASSVTVRVTMAVPAAGNVASTTGPLSVDPSGNDQT